MWKQTSWETQTREGYCRSPAAQARSQLRGGFCQHRYSLKPLRVRDPGLKALLTCDLPQISARTISLVSEMCLLKTPSFELGGDKMRRMSQGPRNMAPFLSPHLLGRGQKHSLLQWQSTATSGSLGPPEVPTWKADFGSKRYEVPHVKSSERPGRLCSITQSPGKCAQWEDSPSGPLPPETGRLGRK